MKIKLFILGVVLGMVFLTNCNDDMGLVGPSMRPDGDIPKVYVDSFYIQASTVLIDSIYAKTASGLLGELYDPLYGNLKSDYICQFYSEDGYQFNFEPIDGKIDSIDVSFAYARGFQGGWIGDSLAPMVATVYPVKNMLDRNYYTNIDPADYADLQNPLGSQAYTARNLNVSDSLWNALNTNSQLEYTPYVTVRLPLELGQKFYDETINNPESFKDQDAFNRFFPGLYITTTFGSGCMLSIHYSCITIHYNTKIENHLGVKDSIVYRYELFPVTKEVIQMNRFKNTDVTELLQPNDEYTYLKSPAGVFTRFTIPAKDIISKIEGRTVNNFFFSLTAMPQENWKYALAPPTYLLLLPEDSLTTFFEKSSVENYITSFLSSGYGSSGVDPYTYSFGNISNLLKNQAENAPDQDLNMLLIPVTRETTSDYYGNVTTSSLYHYLSPAGVKLRKDPEKMKVKVITSIIED